MTGWVILGVWAAGALLVWRSCVWRTASYMGGPPFDGEQIVFGLIFGSGLAAIWPVYLSLRAVTVVYRAHSDGVSSLLEPRHVRRERELSRRRWELADRDQRIRDLERDLGFDSSPTGPRE